MSSPMTREHFDQITRVSRLAVLSAMLQAVVTDDLDASPDVTAVVLRADVRPEGLELSMVYEGPNGLQLGEAML